MVNDVNFTFDVSGFSGAFKVESFRITETVSSPFEMNLTVLSDDDAITFDMLSRKIYLGSTSLVSYSAPRLSYLSDANRARHHSPGI